MLTEGEGGGRVKNWQNLAYVLSLWMPPYQILAWPNSSNYSDCIWCIQSIFKISLLFSVTGSSRKEFVISDWPWPWSCAGAKLIIMRWVGPDHLLLKYTSMANTEFYVVKILYFWSMMPKKWCRKRRRTNVYAVILDIDPYVFCQSVPELCHKMWQNVTKSDKFVTTTQPSDHNFKKK